MIQYKKYQGTSEKTKGKWYARAVTESTITLDELAKHMANHNTPYSAGAIKGVLTDMVSCIKELILEGKAVKLPDLAIFKAGIQCVGAASSAEFTVKGNITGVRLRARATGQLSNANVDLEASLKEYGKYNGGE